MPAERLTDEELDRIERAARARVENWNKGHAAVRAIPQEVLVDIAKVFAEPGDFVLRLVAEVRASRELLADLEWKGMVWYAPHEGEVACPACEASKHDLTQPGFRGRHKPGCKLAALLGREERKL